MVKICHPSHDSLLDRLLELERSVGSANRLSTGELCARLDVLRSELSAHFRSEEQSGALNLLATNEPRFERAARRLVDQHRRLERYLDVLREVAATADRVDDRLRRKVAQLDNPRSKARSRRRCPAARSRQSRHWSRGLKPVKQCERTQMAVMSCGITKLLSGGGHPALAKDLARKLGLPLVEPEVTAFADGETRVHVEEEVWGASVFIVQPTCPPVNDRVMVLALLTDAVRAAGATCVTAIVPYFGYARQELRQRCGDARSAQVIGRLLAAVGVDHVATVDLHAPALEIALPMPVTLLHAEDLFAARVKGWGLRDLVVVSPDAGGMKRAQRFAAALDAPLAVIAKARPRPDAATPLQVLGDVRDRTCVVVDDMASTGRTLVGAAEALAAAGAREMHAVFTHAVMAPGAEDRLAAAPFGRILTSDSIPVALVRGSKWRRSPSCWPAPFDA